MISSLQGQVIYSTQNQLMKGTQILEIPINQLVKGMYIARIETSDELYTLKFMIQ